MDKRLIYRVILKSLFFIAVLGLSVVFINSLFISVNEKTTTHKAFSIVELDVKGMNAGEIRKTSWEGKEVNVIRLESNELFVYINAGDSGNCPLFKEADGFKDICTGTRFDFSGNKKGNEEQGFKLVIPPNYQQNGTLFVGEWAK